MKRFIIVTLTLLSGNLMASDAKPSAYEFELRDPKTKEVYYTGSEKISLDGKTVRRETSYFDAGKKEVQKESFDFDSESLRAASFISINSLTGEESSVAPKDAGFEVTYKAGSDKKASGSQVSGDSYLANAAGDLILANWDKLMAGKSIRFQLIVPSRGEVIPFQLVRREALTVDGEQREVFTLMPQNILIRLLAPHLEFQFTREKKIRMAVFPSGLPINGAKDKMVEMVFKS